MTRLLRAGSRSSGTVRRDHACESIFCAHLTAACKLPHNVSSKHERYHIGAYLKGVWTCCADKAKEAVGCKVRPMSVFGTLRHFRAFHTGRPLVQEARAIRSACQNVISVF